jgi:pimeloyl-ACP methyl ester carboxylesterase
VAFADDGGVQLWFDVKGEGEPLVLTGGFGLLHDQWDRVTDILARDLKVINWHYRGVGLSDRAWPGGYSLDRWADDLEIILAHAGVDKAHFWGTSTGSFLTTRYAARYPGRVKSVITYPLIKANVAFRTAFNGFLYVAENFGYEALAKLTQWIGCAEHNVFGGISNEMAKFEADSFARNFSIESLAKTLEIFGHCDLTSDVAKLTMPTLLLMGNSGQLAASAPGTAELAEIFKSQCPHAEVALIERGGGTYCMLEEPDQTAAVVVDWVGRQA